MSLDSDYQTLIYRTKRRARKDGLTTGERVAINIFWREQVKVPILAKVFKVSKNTIYYKCLTGDAPSYQFSNRSNSAQETNELIERLGHEEARRQFVTEKMQAAVEHELAKEVAREERKARRR